MKKLSLSMLIILLGMILLTGCGASSEDTIEIGVVTGTTFEEEAKKFSKVDDVKLYEDDNQTLQELSSGRIDGVITDMMVGIIGIQEGGFDNIKPVGDLLYRETMAVAYRQEDDALRQEINKVLAEMIADGTYADISKKWFDKDILEGIEYNNTYESDPEAEDESLTKVKDSGKISFAMSGGYPPFNYYDKDNKLVGFDVDVAAEIAKRLGVEFEPVTTEWSGILEGLRSGRYDAILGSMAITDERKEVADFSDPYYYSGAQLFVQTDSEITDPSDLE